jgi:hypothetical protein
MFSSSHPECLFFLSRLPLHACPFSLSPSGSFHLVFVENPIFPKTKMLPGAMLKEMRDRNKNIKEHNPFGVYLDYHHVSLIYCPASFFNRQNSSASARDMFPFCMAVSTSAASTPSDMPPELGRELRPARTAPLCGSQQPS